jgi:hypothetical protein
MSPHTSCNVEFRMRSHDANIVMEHSERESGDESWIEAIRDTLVVLTFQIILRASMTLRRWNY